MYTRNICVGPTRATIALMLLSVFAFGGIFLAPGAPASAGTQDVIGHGETGADIYTIQERLIELGYLNYRATGKFSDLTARAVRSFQAANGLPADGQIGASTMAALFADDAVRQQANPAFSAAVGRAYTGTVKNGGTLSSWEEISRAFPVGSSAVITDYNTGDTFEVIRTGGTNNAQVEGASQDDWETFEYIFGGYTWEHRPVLVEINGTTYAGSLFGMPTRVSQAETRSGTGWTFLYFNNSHADVLELADEEHAVSLSAAASQ